MDKSNLLKDTQVEHERDTAIFVPENEQYSKVRNAVLLKTERLVSAVHLVTGLMDIKETIRWELRSASICSMNDLYDLFSSTGFGSNLSDKILKKISHIISLLEIGLTGGLVSHMNHSILREEYTKLKDTIVRFQLTDGIDSFVLAKHFFGADLQTLKPVVLDTPAVIKDIRNPINRTAGQEVKKDKVSESRGVNKAPRQELILGVIKDTGEYTIKDIIAKVSATGPGVDCSDKTIQRDLLSLVANGMLIKKGERRWSRYSKRVA